MYRWQVVYIYIYIYVALFRGSLRLQHHRLHRTFRPGISHLATKFSVCWMQKS